MTALHVVLVLLITLASAPRWLRVAQREHYESGRVGALALRWLRVVPGNRTFALVLGLLVLIGALLVLVTPALGAVVVLGAIGSAFWPLGLPWRGRERKLAFTPRARRLTLVLLATVLVLDGVAVALALGGTALQSLGLLLAGAVALGLPLVLDGACALAAPVEKRLSGGFVTSAIARLREVDPTVVAITGSYGKTSTKNYTAHLIGTSRAVVPSPASFNNLMGLSKAVNDKLMPGTDVFIAEMGTYGVGEIARLVSTFPPDIAVITAIGDVHLERMKDRATIVRAKSEILVPARVVVLNVDVPELAALAEEQAAAGKEVWRVGSGAVGTPAWAGGQLDVEVRAGTDGTVGIKVRGEDLGSWPVGATVHPTNLAAAIGIISALDVPASLWLKRIAGIPDVPHRREISMSPAGVTVIDDTYNANPDGAASALALGARLAKEHGGELWVVTPGMIELGPNEDAENQRFGAAVLAADASLIVVGYTNKAAFQAAVAGASGPYRSATFLPDRPTAVKLVHTRARSGDVVLFENDLPDHYP